MTHADALTRLAQCRESQPGAWQVIVSRDIVDALLREDALSPCCTGDCGVPAIRMVRLRGVGPVDGGPWPYCGDCSEVLIRTGDVDCGPVIA